jgi:enoyl-[acyl-carrier-protein] reductase (NADH)
MNPIGLSTSALIAVKTDPSKIDYMRTFGQKVFRLRRLGTHEDLAAVVFLDSGASDCITGQILYIDGGFTAVG